MLHIRRPGVPQDWHRRSLKNSPFPLQGIKQSVNLKQSRDHGALGCFSWPFVEGERGALSYNKWKSGASQGPNKHFATFAWVWRTHGLGCHTFSNLFIHSFNQYLLSQLTHTMHCAGCRILGLFLFFNPKITYCIKITELKCKLSGHLLFAFSQIHFCLFWLKLLIWIWEFSLAPHRYFGPPSAQVWNKWP